MTIFGKAVGRLPFLNGSEGQSVISDVILREGNDWDIFLNYFFALLFICCLLIGVSVNSLIILYHSKQNRSFANILFLLISSIDLIKSVYFPLVFIPKLLSPQDDDEYFLDSKLTSIPWTSYTNHLVLSAIGIEINLLIVLCGARYFTFKYPLSDSRKRNVVFSSVLVANTLNSVAWNFIVYFYEPFTHSKLHDFVISMDIKYITGTVIPLWYTGVCLQCMYLLAGGVFSGLTIVHLKNSDTAASEASTRNIRKGIVAIVAMNEFNAFVILSYVAMSIILHEMNKDWRNVKHSTLSDFIQFTSAYGIKLIQSAFNSVSFLISCSSFKEFVKKFTGRVNPSTKQQNRPTNPLTEN